MKLTKYSFNSNLFNLDRAKVELLAHLEKCGDQLSSTWGFFPELKPEIKDYPESLKLLQSLKDTFYKDRDITPAFLRVATKEPVSNFGGLHIDVSTGIGHTKLHAEGEIVRILINLGDTPRKLEYVPFTLSELKRQFNYTVPEENYSIIKLPPEIPTKIIEIPPIENEALYSLEFISSQIIHAGRTDANGHFLACFGGLVFQK